MVLIDPRALVTHLLGRVENDAIQNVAAGSGVTCSEGFTSQGLSMWTKGEGLGCLQEADQKGQVESSRKK